MASSENDDDDDDDDDDDSESDPELSDTDEEDEQLALADTKKKGNVSDLSFFSTSSDVTGAAFDKYTSLVAPGKVLVARHYDENGFFITEVVYAVIAMLAHRDSLLVEATFCGSPAKAPADLQN